MQIKKKLYVARKLFSVKAQCSCCRQYEVQKLPTNQPDYHFLVYQVILYVLVIYKWLLPMRSDLDMKKEGI